MSTTAGSIRPTTPVEPRGRPSVNTTKEALVARLFTFLQSYLATRQPGETGESNDDTGATMVEYGLIVSVIALVVVVGATVFGTALSTFFSDLAGSL